MKNPKLHLQLFLMFVVILAVVIVFTQGSRYFGKTYYESNQFDSESQHFASQLMRYVINPATEEDFKEILTVSKDEIERYRTYYGSLAEQIQNIKDQYAGDLDAAQDAEIIAAYEQERDKKIADIKKNFEDDDYVKEKILTVKQQALNEMLAEQKRKQKDFLNEYNYFAYDFTNQQTGETYKKGEVDAAAAYKREILSDQLNVSDTYHFNVYDYEHIGFLNTDYTIEKEPIAISGVVTVPKSALAKTSFGRDLEGFTTSKYIYYGLVLAGIISFFLLMTSLEPTKKSFLVDSPLRRFYERLPVDIGWTVLLVVGYIAFAFLEVMTWRVESIGHSIRGNYSLDVVSSLLPFLIGYGFVVLTIFLAIWLYDRMTQHSNFDQLAQETFFVKVLGAGKAMFENRSIGLQSLILLLVIFLGGFGFAVVTMSGSAEVFVFYLLLFVVFFIPALYLFMRRIGYLNRIMHHTEDMAHGRLTKDLKVKGNSPLAKHAENLNGLREGVRSSINEQAKSERMKTELITNVSHDLRTPLTSIITYTDLLKNPALSEEERTKYISILDAKSNRLKTLIEDLFEVSKMASGNIEISKQRIDLAQLLQQAAGEHGEDFISSNLDLRLNIKDQPIYAYVDGQKWWRVIDNLIVNARKYSLEGTRVYVTLKMVEGNAELTVKNVAKYELYEDASELIERFKRADTSRHTDGSGLGLAIAQSIVDLHGGTMEIAVDGDLFKVTVSVRADN